MTCFKLKIFLIVYIGTIVACGQAVTCPIYDYADQFAYTVTPTLMTPGRIKVDSTGQDVNLLQIDDLTNSVETCLQITHPGPLCQCLTTVFELSFPRECLTVKIPNDWIWSCDGKWELLPALAPDELCLLKGLVPTPECPCRWRAGIQNQHTVVVTPDLRMYADPLIRILTGCNNPWCNELANCADLSLGESK